MFATIMAALAALPEIVKVLGEVASALKQLRQDSINKELEKIKTDVSKKLLEVEGAQTNEERRRLALELALLLSK